MRVLRSITALRALPVAAIGVLALACAPAAFADTSKSSNWAGYAVHHSRVSFKKVIGTWTEPSATCTRGTPSYSSLWVGIGGYSVNSRALEQIGTELDCTAGGRAVSTAWYELVPAASQSIRLTIRPHDRVRAEVAIAGRSVSLTLQDLTRHTTFRRIVHASVLDTTSAEWILEAPSVCSGGSTCQTLPLADFGSAAFTGGSAQATTGHTGTIGDRHWTTTKILMSDSGRRFISGGSPTAPAGAVPSALNRSGSAFTVAYQGASAPTTSSQFPAQRVMASRLVRPAPRFVRPARAR